MLYSLYIRHLVKLVYWYLLNYTKGPYFLKYFNIKLHISTKYFGETLEGTGQAEDYRLKLSPKKASQQYEAL
ncbi:hypothetical protein A7U35_05495 [Staphylococcus epidermidis]|nr:hypothetical protein A7I04_12065 [Staphylococcus epidermidis]OAW76284.1 hypothetical protein A7U35_05495 [Staphylococcus epidermidis]